MNLHMPQDLESEAELRGLAAVPYQIISPGNNSAIMGIFQDSMLGSYLFSREGVQFSPREAMNLLMMIDTVNEKELGKILEENKAVSNFDILSQIMPPLSMKYKTKAFNPDKTDKENHNAIIEIINGSFKRGQLDKSVLGGNTRGLLQRICNDFGNFASAKFIDDLQNIVTTYMKTAAFSVGVSDLVSNKKTDDQIVEVITKSKNDVQNLIDQTQIGVFENNTGRTNREEFELKVNNILNQATSESGKIGLKSLSKGNRFVTMVNAGSKGSDLNISFMISCLGQQNVFGERIPYGFDYRTLPHFTKFDDSPGARGFVESSYINGLSPQELFMHAQGGREGLIDTAVKTSSTGYIQRRLIKGLEDLMVSYDMTIRSNKGKIVQFAYGDDSIDTVKVENQPMPLVTMSVQEIYAHFNILEESDKSKVLSKVFLKNALARYRNQKAKMMELNQKYTDFMIQMRGEIVKNVFKFKGDSTVNSPVGFQYIINNVQGQMHLSSSSLVDITPAEVYELLEAFYENLEKIHFAPPTALFKVLFFFNLSPKELLVVKRFNRNAIMLLLDAIHVAYKRALVAPGEMVGLLAGQSIGEISTQMTLNSFHFAGVASKSNVTRGVPRIEEILSVSTEPKMPSLTVFLKPEDESSKERAQSIMYMLEHTCLEEIVESISIYFDPDDLNSLIEEDRGTIEQFRYFENMVKDCAAISVDEGEEEANKKSKWIIRMEMDPEIMLEKNITMEDVSFTLRSAFGEDINCIYTDYNADKLVFRVRMNEILKNSFKTSKKKNAPLDQSDQIYVLKNLQDQILQNTVLRGIKGIGKVTMRKIKDNVVENNGVYVKQDIWVLDTMGTNMIDVMGLDYIDPYRTFSNDIVEVYETLGIEAARQAIYNEMVDVIEFDGTYINYHNFSVLVDRMTFTSKIISIFRHGINNDNIGPIAKASFEETPEMFLKAARHADLDPMRGISANIMCGQEGFFGTSAFQVVLDLEEMAKLHETSGYSDPVEPLQIEPVPEEEKDHCSIQKLAVQNNVVSIKETDMGDDNDEYNPGF